MRADKQILKDVERELENFPGATVELRKTKRHKELTLVYEGKTRKVFTSTSPSDGRAALNVVGDVRRALREMGE